MSKLTIWHNPRCSKSRQTLALLQSKGLQPDIREYLQSPPSCDELRSVLALLGFSARELIRSKEGAFKDLKLSDKTLSEDALIKAMVEHPKLIERPIVIAGQRAAVGRPPESVLAILV